MGTIDNTRRIIREDYDSKYHDLIDKLGYVLNTFMEQTIQQVNGNLDEIRIWDFAMSSGDITSRYNAGVPDVPTISEYPANEQFYMNFDDNADDQSQNSNDGTETNSPEYQVDIA